MEGHTDEPPAYTPSPNRIRTGAGSFRQEHRYMLQDKRGRDWVAFKVRSRAVDPKHAPLFFEGDTIKGEVQLDFAKAQTLKGLTITVRAPGFFPRPTRTLANTCPLPLFSSPLRKGSRGDDGCGAGGGSVFGHNGACVDACVRERKRSRRPAHVPVFHHPPARRHPRARAPGRTQELPAPAYVLGARKPRVYRLQTVRDRAPRQAAGGQAVRRPHPSVSPSSSALVTHTSSAADEDCGAQVVDELCVPPAQRGETAVCVARTRVCRRRRGPWPGRGPRRLEGLRPR